MANVQSIEEMRAKEISVTTNSTPAIGPCPCHFCKSDRAVLIRSDDFDPQTFVECKQCGAMGSHFGRGQEDRAISAWNALSHPAPQSMEREELESILLDACVFGKNSPTGKRILSAFDSLRARVDTEKLREIRDFIIGSTLYVNELEEGIGVENMEFWEAREKAYHLASGMLIDAYQAEEDFTAALKGAGARKEQDNG